MNEGRPYSDWYDQSLPASAPVSPLPVRAVKKKTHTGMKVTSIALCVLLLIVASVYAFSDRDPAPGGAWTFDPSRNWDETPRSRAEDRNDTEDSFRDFIEEYYSGLSEDDTVPASAMARAEGDPGFAMTLVSADEKEELSLQELYRANIDSVVGIKAFYDSGYSYGWGTGIVLTKGGYIVTNQHIVSEAVRAFVVLPDGSEHEALLVGEDTQTDIAVLKIEVPFPLPPAEFGDSGALTVGDRVAAIGNPLGDELTGTMTDGIVSAIDRNVRMNGRRMTLIQTNAAINEGNSGGPLINMYGQVIGITNMKMVNRYSSVTIEGIGFAIPSVTIKTIADQLIARGAVEGRPGLGITVGQIPEEASSQYELPEGLYILSVSEGSDAADKGVLPGDILTHVNGQKVLLTTDVLAIRDTLSVGDELALTLWRDGETLEITIELRDLNSLY